MREITLRERKRVRKALIVIEIRLGNKNSTISKVYILFSHRVLYLCREAIFPEERGCLSAQTVCRRSETRPWRHTRKLIRSTSFAKTSFSKPFVWVLNSLSLWSLPASPIFSLAPFVSLVERKASRPCFCATVSLCVHEFFLFLWKILSHFCRKD